MSQLKMPYWLEVCAWTRSTRLARGGKACAGEFGFRHIRSTTCRCIRGISVQLSRRRRPIEEGH